MGKKTKRINYYSLFLEGENVRKNHKYIIIDPKDSDLIMIKYNLFPKRRNLNRIGMIELVIVAKM